MALFDKTPFITREIGEYGEDWREYGGAEIQKFIEDKLAEQEATTANKIGYLHCPTDKGEDNLYHLYGFASRASFEQWEANPEASLILVDIVLPSSSNTGAVGYAVSLDCAVSGEVETIDETVKLKLRYTSVKMDPISGNSDTNESAKVTIYTRTTDTEAWKAQGSFTIKSLPRGSAEWHEVDITKYTTAGIQQVRLVAKGDSTETNATPVVFSLNRTTLKLTPATDWAEPVGASDNFAVSYYIYGAVSKALHLLVDGDRELIFDLGKNVATSTPRTFVITDGEFDAVKVRENGSHSVEAWLVTANGTESEHIVTERYVALDDTATTSAVVNNLATDVQNWSTKQLLSLAICKPNTEGEKANIAIALTNHSGSETYLRDELGEHSYNSVVNYAPTLEIDRTEKRIDVCVRIYVNGSELRNFTGVSIDNANNFAPTAGFDLFVNPLKRSNNETNPKSIVNAKNNAAVSSEWNGFGLQADGWVTDTEGVKCLRVLPNQSIKIDYNAFDRKTSTGAPDSVTFEIDFAPTSITDEAAPLVQMCSRKENGIHQGIEILPLQCRLFTAKLYSDVNQVVDLESDTRHHIAVNIVRNLSTILNGKTERLNIARVYVDGVLSREFEWADNDSFIGDDAKFILGGAGATLDIYSLRVYKTALSSSDVLANYIASQSSVERKLALRAANDITDDAGEISYDKAKQIYPTMKLRLPSLADLPSFRKGDKKYSTSCSEVVFGRRQADGSYLMESLTNVALAGQGTSSMDYYEWNLSFKFTADTVWTDVAGNQSTDGYCLDPTMPKATKLVAKANFASSQQTHKIGSVNAYHDLWEEVMAEMGTPSELLAVPGLEKSRVSVKQEPFLGFVEDSDGKVTFTGLYTFGPGKGDKLTFGYDKNRSPYYFMIEGADNGVPLVNHRMPWDDSIVYDAAKEGYMYGQQMQFGFTLGKVTPEGEQAFKDFANFVYFNSPHLEYFNGTADELKASADINKAKIYWATAGEKKYCAYRYDELTSAWIEAGLNGTELNLKADLGVTINASEQANTINNKFIAARIMRFRANAHKYMIVNDGLFHSSDTLIIAASDNRAKNTYLYIVKMVDGTFRVRWAQDDLDTIFKTNNVGVLTKPYYVEPLDVNPNDAQPYWQGSDNALYRLFELAYPTELRAMTKTVLAKANKLGGSLIGFFDKYYFSVAKLFPAVAYNETARIRYESAAYAVKAGTYSSSVDPLAQSLGSQIHAEREWLKKRLAYMSSYAGFGDFENGKSLQFRSIAKRDGSAPTYEFALTPSQWLYPCVISGSSAFYGINKAQPQRVKAGETYMLGGVLGGGDNSTKIVGIDYYKAVGTFGDKAVGGDMFTLTGAQITDFDASAISTETHEFRPKGFKSEAPLLRRLSLRNIASITGEIDLSASNLLEVVDLRGTSATSVKFGNTANLKELYLPDGVESISLKGSKISALNLGSKIKTLSLVDMPNLDTVTLADYSNIESLTMTGCPVMEQGSNGNIRSWVFVWECIKAAGTKLKNVALGPVAYPNFSTAALKRLIAIPGLTLTGHIKMEPGAVGEIPYALKQTLTSKFGDLKTGSLVIDYADIAPTSVRRSTDQVYYDKVGSYQQTLAFAPINANAVKSVEWSITDNPHATITSDGILTVASVGTDTDKPSAIITCRVIAYGATADGSVDLTAEVELTHTSEVRFYHHECAVGDLVYADGSFSDIYDPSKTVVGLCAYVDANNPSQRWMASMGELGNYIWGLSNGLSNFSNPNYNPYDIPALTNVNQTQALAEIGFAELTTDTLGFAAGTMMPYGKINTLAIIQHRNTILSDPGVAKPIPPLTGVGNSLVTLKQYMSAVNKGTQLYYAAASICYHYEPQVREGEALNPKFRAGQWFLPSAAELKLLSQLHREGYSQSNLAPFALGAAKAGFVPFCKGGNSYWSSDEYYQQYAWNVSVASGALDNYGFKDNYSYVVRALAAF